MALVLACLLGPLALIAHWADHTVADTDAYVDTVAPLAEDPAIQRAVATQVTTAIMDAVDDAQILQRLIDRAFADRSLPPALEDLLRAATGSVRTQVETRVARAATRLTTSDAFTDSWRSANEVAHRQLVAALSGESQVVDSSGTVTIELAAIVNAVRQVLIDQGLDLIGQLPEVEASFPIADVEQLDTVGAAYDVLHRWAGRLAVAFVVTLLVGLALAQHRRRALTRVAVGGMLVLAVVLTAIAFGQQAALDALPAGTPGDAVDAAQAAITILTDPLRTEIRTALWLLLAILALVAVVTLATGTGPRSTLLRATVLRAVAAARTRWGSAPWPPLVGGVVALAGLVVLLFWTPGPVASLCLLGLILVSTSVTAVLVRDVRLEDTDA